MAEPGDMMMPVLRETRAENGALRAATIGRLVLPERRLKTIEDAQAVSALEGPK